MFQTIRQRWRDMGTIKSLCSEAERIANAQGRTDPNAEDFLLSALALPDGTARQAFARVRADPDRLLEAIDRQYKDALHSVGIDVSNLASSASDGPVMAPRKIYKAGPSGQALLHTMIYDIKVREHKTSPAAPLLGAHVVLAATGSRRGVVARALQAMNVDAIELAKAARAEIEAYRA
ncbi:MAG: peptidase [Rubrivivax sp.]|nr:MAG: peptidase [Rubrivivax sp.]